MKKFQKFERFPLGTIYAEGFLKEQMLRGKDGMSGHLHELEPEMIADPYVNKRYVPAWGDGDQSGWGAEISGNYWAGYIQYAYTLNDADMIRVATEWVDSVLKNQRADGYLGTYYEEDANIYEDYNATGNACGMRALISFYEATGRRDVLDAVHRCMLWFCDKWSGDRKTVYASAVIIEPMIFTYYHTGDVRLVKFCEDLVEYVSRHDIFEWSCDAMLTKEYHYNAAHTAGYGILSRMPALLYTATGNEKYLKASVRALDMVYEKSVQVTGSPVSDNEYLSPVGAIAETEYCCYNYYDLTYSHMGCITGDTKYGDRMEEIFYNGAQGARKKDERAIAYFNSPNQVYATKKSSRNGAPTQAYAPCFPTSCCPVNSVSVVPDFVRGTILHDSEENIYLFAYGPCSLRYRDLEIKVNTYYPFRNHVEIEIDCQKEFAVNLRIPAFAKGYALSVNGEILDATENSGFVVVKRKWKKGDRVKIHFQAEIETVVLHDEDCSKKYPIAIRYGALVFAYHIPERWQPYDGIPMTKLPDGWSWYNVTPDFEEANVEDAHERIGLRREQISWNIAVDEDLSAKDFEIEEIDQNGYVWENPMIRLHTHAYKAPYMFPPYPAQTFEPYGEYQTVSKKTPLTLEPYGCTNLRITYFPKAKLEKKRRIP